MEGRREGRKKEEKRQRGAEGNKGGRFKKREICLLISLFLKVKFIIDKLCTLLTKSYTTFYSSLYNSSLSCPSYVHKMIFGF